MIPETFYTMALYYKKNFAPLRFLMVFVQYINFVIPSDVYRLDIITRQKLEINV